MMPKLIIASNLVLNMHYAILDLEPGTRRSTSARCRLVFREETAFSLLRSGCPVFSRISSLDPFMIVSVVVSEYFALVRGLALLSLRIPLPPI
jgi:hypothetical protein